MFSFIIETLRNDNHFKGKGIYLENQVNSWINFIPLNDESVRIQWKNGGFKKRSEKITPNEDAFPLFKEWKEEINRSGIENKILRIFEDNKEYFKEKIILGQKEFRKNTRSFEISLEEKLKESNENYQHPDQIFISYITLYFLLKQFRIKIKMKTFGITNPLKQEIVLFKRNKEIIPVRTPLEFKLVLEDSLSKKEKQCLKQEFVEKAKDYLTSYTDLQHTGINRLLEKFKI